MRHVTIWSLCFCLLVAFSQCSNKSNEGEKAESKEDKQVEEQAEQKQKLENQFKHISATYKVDPAISIIEWAGQQPTGPKNGVVEIKKGRVEVSKGKITGGKIVIDMTTIESTDRGLSDDKQKQLTNTLKSKSFFHADSFPRAIYKITGSKVSPSAGSAIPSKQAYKIKGKLTLKNTTKPMSFTAKVKLDEQKISADANFNLDRTKWGITHQVDTSFGQERVMPEINIGFMLSGKKKSNAQASR